MNLLEYMRDHILLYLLHAVCMLALSGFLYLTGYPWGSCLLILICWLLVLAGWTFTTFINRKRYFSRMEQVLAKVDQRYLLGELMPQSLRLEDRLYREMIRRSNQSVIERIHRIEEERKDYREFVENWVHEIKAPVTAIALICGNRQDDCLERIAVQNDRIENCVDMALYYARSDEVYKDYLIRETDLSELVMETIVKNKRYLILNHVQVETDCRHSACTDGKWISFILTQLLLNSAKYRRGEHARIWIWTEQTAKGVCLYVKDNGLGIAKEDLPRVFEKGFTGRNGRPGGGSGAKPEQEKREGATGMGLYLCRKLCGKLGAGISIESAVGEGTTVVLDFPVSGFVEAGRWNLSKS